MFSTTTLIAVQMIYVKHLSIIIAAAFFLTFGFFDGEVRYTYYRLGPHRLLGLFWGAALKKIPHVSRLFHVRISSTNPTYVGRMGTLHARHNHDDIHALLDVG